MQKTLNATRSTLNDSPFCSRAIFGMRDHLFKDTTLNSKPLQQDFPNHFEYNRKHPSNHVLPGRGWCGQLCFATKTTAIMAKRKQSTRRWADILSRYADWQGSVRAFCAREGISVASCYYWRRKQETAAIRLRDLCSVCLVRCSAFVGFDKRGGGTISRDVAPAAKTTAQRSDCYQGFTTISSSWMISACSGFVSGLSVHSSNRHSLPWQSR